MLQGANQSWRQPVVLYVWKNHKRQLLQFDRVREAGSEGDRYSRSRRNFRYRFRRPGLGSFRAVEDEPCIEHCDLLLVRDERGIQVQSNYRGTVQLTQFRV